MMHRILISIALLTTICAVTSGCERSDPADSPPVTFSSSAEEEQESEQEQEPEPEQEAAESPEEIEPQDAELPEGTEEQQALLNEGRKAFLSDQYEEATEIFEELAFDEPVTSDTVSAAVALGQIYLETDRSDEALEMYDNLFEHVSHIPEVIFVIARVFDDLDEPMRALRAYDRAYELNNDYIFILPKMAEILLQDGDEERSGQLLYRYEQRVHQFSNLLESPDEVSEEHRIYVLDILAMLHDERSHRALTNALADPAPQIRADAATALGELAVSEAEDDLRTLATDDDSEAVRVAARHSLETLRNYQSEE